jgi:hypothetical protein
VTDGNKNQAPNPKEPDPRESTDMGGQVLDLLGYEGPRSEETADFQNELVFAILGRLSKEGSADAKKLLGAIGLTEPVSGGSSEIDLHEVSAALDAMRTGKTGGEEAKHLSQLATATGNAAAMIIRLMEPHDEEKGTRIVQAELDKLGIADVPEDTGEQMRSLVKDVAAQLGADSRTP